MFMFMARSRRPRRYWTLEETNTLKEAVNKYGKKWSVIEKMFPIFKKNNRTQVDIKDKWRNLNISNAVNNNSLNDMGESSNSSIYLKRKSPQTIRRISSSNISRSHSLKYRRTPNYNTYRSPQRRKISLKNNRFASPQRYKKLKSVPRKKPDTIENSSYVIYSKEGCPFCNNAKSLLKSKKIAFSEIKVTDKNIKKIYSEIDKKTKNYRYFPIIFKNNKFIGGFAELQKIKL